MGPRPGVALFLTVLVLVLVTAGAAQAATIQVANGNDSGPGSLRSAVAAAGTGDTISIPPLTVGLTSGQITITKSIIIKGAGARQTTITGNNESRIFNIGSGTVSVSGVTLTGGNGFNTPGGTAGGGGAIALGSGTLTLTDTSVTGNTSTGSNDGGGIYASGSLTLVRTTVAFDTAPADNRGGGIAFGGSGTLQVTNSTFSHDSLQSGGLGAAIYVNSAGSVSLTNDTMALDPAGASGSVLDLNGGSMPYSITNTIVLGGSGNSCSRMGSGGSQGGNIEDQSNCVFTGPTDHQNAALSLGPLQNNGGPTDTQLPAAGSIAIDKGSDASCPATDQRGVPRPQGPHCDIGAVERTTPSVSTPAVSNVTASGASLSAVANSVWPGGSYVYNYGTTKAYGQSTAPAQLPSGNGSQATPGSLSGLSPGTIYHLQLVVTTPDGTATSPDVTFTTQPAPPPRAKASLTGLAITPKTLSPSGRRVKGRCLTPSKTNRHKPRCRRPIAFLVTYSLSADGPVAFTIQRESPGRQVKSRCVAPSRKNRGHRKCTRIIGVPGSLSVAGHSGANSFIFNGMIGSRKLGPGTYELLATAAGGRPRVVTFTLTS